MSLSSSVTSLSDYGSSCKSEDLQQEHYDTSVAWMLMQLDIHHDESSTLLPRNCPQNKQQTRLSRAHHHDQNEFEPPCERVTSTAFLHGRPQWIDDPITSQWRSPNSDLLAKLETIDHLYCEWTQSPPGPFSPHFDRVWLETAVSLQNAGLPWYNTSFSMPEELDASWPFHFKDFERAAVLAKGRRVADPDATGYITSWSEGNYWGIRALKQELIRQFPDRKPLLLTHHFEAEQAEAASVLFGLEWHQIDLKELGPLCQTIESLNLKEQRPIIFAATMANSRGEVDDFAAIDKLARRFPLILHLDAHRVFDFLTTVDEELRTALDLPRLRLHHPEVGSSPCFVDGQIMAASIVAGGSNAYISPPPVVVLKPKLLGTQALVTVEYVRGTDSTLAGSRDSLGPLMMSLQELRFGTDGFREIHSACVRRRLQLMDELRTLKIPFTASSTTLDLTLSILDPSQFEKVVELGATSVGSDNLLLTIQPSVSDGDVQSLLSILGTSGESRTPNPLRLLQPRSSSSKYALPKGVDEKLQDRVRNLKVAARSSFGYPFNQVTYSTLGPAIAPFLTTPYPEEWTLAEASRIWCRRKESLGLHTRHSQRLFKSAFTTGSTMGNRIGIHAALSQYPNAFFYFSSASHYSVRKTVRDCDTLTNQWHPGRAPRASEIPADQYGRMIPEALVRQVQSDRAECIAHDEDYQLVLFANLGTTFVGGRDDLHTIRQFLSSIDVVPSYVHVDGALDLGFQHSEIQLGPPSLSYSPTAATIVQGITLSHHKVLGTMVSGEVISYSPPNAPSTTWFPTTTIVDPRAVFELYLCNLLYPPHTLATLQTYCASNSTLLRDLLTAAGIPSLSNPESLITCFPRPPPWLLRTFHLAPEGDWVHAITMPHINPASVRNLVRALTRVEEAHETAFEYMAPACATAFATALRRPLDSEFRFARLTCRSAHVEAALELMERARRVEKDGDEGGWKGMLGLGTRKDFMTRYVYGAVSVAVLDEEDALVGLFLAEATGDRVILPGPVLIAAETVGTENEGMMAEVARLLFGHTASLMDARIEQGKNSYQVAECRCE